jgi:hypothetical protein
VVAHVARKHDHTWLVREFDGGRLSDICRNHEWPQAVIRKPSLEDILLTLLRQNRQDALESREAEAIVT